MKKPKRSSEDGSYGIVALVTGIVGFFFFPFILNIIAIIFGAIAYNKKQKYGVAGLVLGILGILWSFVSITIWLIILERLKLY